MHRILTASLLAAAGLATGAAPASAASDLNCPNILQITAAQTGVHCVLNLNKSKVIELPRPAKDVLVSNPVIADAVMRANNRIYITGLAVGQASVFIFDRDNKLMVNLELEIERDIAGIEATVNRLIPGANIKAELINDNLVLSGTVKSAVDARRAADLADAFANGGANSENQQDRDRNKGTGTTVIVGNDDSSKKSRIVNMIAIEGQEQVMLKVTVAEIQRSIVKQLGIDFQASASNVGFSAGVISSGAFPVNYSLQNPTSGFQINGPGGIQATIQALEQTGVLRTLAEPTLTAISGESASFLAGGEFPVPTGRSISDTGQATITYTYKTYGVGLAFTPVVLAEGRISLRVKTEVSDTSTDGAQQLGGVTATTLSLPSLRVRRAETTIELPSGGSMVMAGLLQDDVRQAVAALPGLAKLPVLGTLFRSRDFQRRESELVIIITPYLVKPTARTALARPDDGFNAPNDAAANFLGRVNRMYGVQGKPAPKATYQGRVGYIYE